MTVALYSRYGAFGPGCPSRQCPSWLGLARDAFPFLSHPLECAFPKPNFNRLGSRLGSAHCMTIVLEPNTNAQRMSLLSHLLCSSLAAISRDCHSLLRSLYRCDSKDILWACVFSSGIVHIWAQGWNIQTLISHEPLVCSKMCFSKTKPVQ